ncbi:ABC transporter ATP-binding protein/permease [Olsenella uli]|uniref:ATP-binding cassette domain-containing protein n=1 Tax=Olsenella uli TaxID=133926 RepID=UPI00195A4AAA|nr:ABC transporter ATP-binding protein/permease [Olsenella uli]
MATLVASHISRSFGDGAERQVVLDDLTLELSSPALVAVLGESGCGKTTLLNILGGLDHSFQGDLLVDGRDTRDYAERDWDRYRAREVGLVFQSPNLIGHLNVMENVRLAQSLAGVPTLEAARLRERALERCGIAGLADKRPATLSGGQALRASVARALAKDPTILLADEPTGSLDEGSGRDVMELLAELARERLVIVVTHNERLARTYATQIVRLEHGRAVREAPAPAGRREATGGRRTAARSAPRRGIAQLALRHLMRRKGRSLVTGVAVTLAALSSILMVALGLGSHDFLERLALGLTLTHPLVVSTDPSLDLSVGADAAAGDALTVSDAGARALGALEGAQTAEGALGDLYGYLTLSHPEVAGDVLDIQRGYDLELNLYDSEGEQLLRAGSPVLGERLAKAGLVEPEMRSEIEARIPSTGLMQELVRNDATGTAPYEVLAGRLPESADEVVLIVGRDGTMLDLVAAELGLVGTDELAERAGEEDAQPLELPYEDLLGTTYRIVPTADYYYRSTDGSRWLDARTEESSVRLPQIIDEARRLTVVGVVRPEERYADASFTGAIGYDAGLVEALVGDAWESGVVREQAARPDVDVFSGRSFEDGLARGDVGADDLVALAGELGLSTGKTEVLAALTDEQAGALATRLGYDGDPSQLDDGVLDELRALSDDEFSRLVASYATADLSASYAQNMAWLGGIDLDEPTELRIYVSDAEQSDLVRAAVSDYARLRGLGDGGLSCASDLQQLVDQANATVATIDLVLVVLSLVLGTLSVFLVASTTSISALERTGEIAVLRALGATRGDVTALFLGENLLIGVAAGIAGGLLAWALGPFVNSYVTMFTNMGSLVSIGAWACLPAAACCGALTALAGLVPARRAARRDPAGIVRDLTV